MSYISTREKYSHLKQLMELANADGAFSIAELSFVVWTAKKLDVSDKELQRIAKDSVPHASPLLEADRLKFFHDCLKLIYLDGKVDPDEIEHCLNIGLSINLDQKKLERIIQRTQQIPPKMISSEELKTLYYDI